MRKCLIILLALSSFHVSPSSFAVAGDPGKWFALTRQDAQSEWVTLVQDEVCFRFGDDCLETAVNQQAGIAGCSRQDNWWEYLSTTYSWNDYFAAYYIAGAAWTDCDINEILVFYVPVETCPATIPPDPPPVFTSCSGSYLLHSGSDPLCPDQTTGTCRLGICTDITGNAGCMAVDFSTSGTSPDVWTGQVMAKLIDGAWGANVGCDISETYSQWPLQRNYGSVNVLGTSCIHTFSEIPPNELLSSSSSSSSSSSTSTSSSSSSSSGGTSTSSSSGGTSTSSSSSSGGDTSTSSSGGTSTSSSSGGTSTSSSGSSSSSSSSSGSASGGETCGSEPICEGDPIVCAQLIQQWRTRCEYTNFGPFDLTDPDLQPLTEETVQVDQIVQNEILNQTSDYVASCPPDIVFTALGHTVNMSYQYICDFATAIYDIVILIASILAFYIVGRFVQGGL